MSQLFAVTLKVQPNPIVEQLIEYRWLSGTWFNVTEQRHTGDDTLTHAAFPNIVSVTFGDPREPSLILTKHEWQAVGSPLMLTPSEIQIIKNTINVAHGLDARSPK